MVYDYQDIYLLEKIVISEFATSIKKKKAPSEQCCKRDVFILCCFILQTSLNLNKINRKTYSLNALHSEVLPKSC